MQGKSSSTSEATKQLSQTTKPGAQDNNIDILFRDILVLPLHKSEIGTLSFLVAHRYNNPHSPQFQLVKSYLAFC